MTLIRTAVCHRTTALLVLALGLAPGCASRGSVADTRSGDAAPFDLSPLVFTDVKLGDLPTTCFAEGEGFHKSVEPYAKCCSGLTKVINWQQWKVHCSGPGRNSPAPFDFLCTACGDGKCGKGEDFCICPADCTYAECLEEGKYWETMGDLMGYRCCEGLSFLEWREPSGDGCTVSPSLYYCTRCGDGQCGTKENRCNCPEDCS